MGIKFNARTNAIETDATSIDFTQPITTPASTTSLAGLNIAEGVAPSAPVDGDVWVTAAGEFNARLNGVTVDLSGGGVTASGTPVDSQLAVWTGASDIEGDANLTWNGTSQYLSIGSDGGRIARTGASSMAFQTDTGTAWMTYTAGVLLVQNTTRMDGGNILKFYGTGASPRVNVYANNATGALVIDNESGFTKLNVEKPVEIGSLTQGESITVPASYTGLVSKQYSGVGNTSLMEQSDSGVLMGVANYAEVLYTFNNPTASADPGGGFFRVNNASFASATELYVDDLDLSNLDQAWFWSMLNVGDILMLHQTSDRTKWLHAEVSSITDNTGWYTIGISPIESSGTVFTNAATVGFIVKRATETFGGTGQTTYATGDILYASGANTLSKLAAGTNTHVLTLSGGVPTWAAAAGGGNVSNTGTPVNNQLAIWTDATTIEGDAKVTFDGSSFAAYGDGTATDLHYLGLDSTNRFRFECGTNYGMILYEDDNVSTEDQFFYIGNDSLSTGNQNILFRDGGADWYHAEYFGTTARYRHIGPIEIQGTTDHVGTGGLGTGIDSNYIQLWGKSLTLDHEPMITCGDLDIDHTVANIIETCFHFDQTTTAADPGAGNLRWNNATPGSVTNWYVDDLESTGKDASFVLSNLSNGDVITLRSQWDDADYMVASVNGTPTDNTGYWTIPVTVIHAGGRPATGDPVHLLVDWVNPLQNNVYARKSTGTQTVSSTTFTTATNYSGISLDAGVYLCSGQFRVNRNNTSNNVQIRWTSSTYRTSSPSTDMDSSRTRVFFTYSDSGGTTQFAQMVGDATTAVALNLSTNASTSWVQVEGVFTVNSATTLDWEIRTSNVATSIRMEDGGVIKFTKISGSTTTTSGTYLS
jgi:hypothetical protein